MRKLILLAIGVAALCLMSRASAQEAKGVTVDKARNAVLVDAKIAPRKLPHLDKSYPIELIACWAHPRAPPTYER